MISYFPDFYPDEILYSACARYIVHVNLKAQRASLEALFENRNKSAVVDLPSDISILVRQIPNEFNNAKLIINNHTLLPFYKPFLPQARLNLVQELMMDNPDKKNIPGTLGLMSSGIPFPHRLRFCDECSEEDKKIFGEMYWHRMHQIPGVFFCEKHQKVLLETMINYTGRGRKHHFVPLEKVKEDKMYFKPKSFPEGCEKNLMEISKIACKFLNANIEPVGLMNIQESYKALLSEDGYITQNNNVRFRNLKNNFNSYFGQELLSILTSIVQKETDTWLHKLLRKPRVTCHPIRHILLILFLGADIDLFKNIYKKPSPFGEGPWYCLNQAANHFHQPTIKECRITYGSNSNIPIGIFSCSCGFTYSRKGPDKNREDKFRKDRVHCFGEKWIEECQKVYKNPELSLRAKAKRLGVDPKTMIKYSSYENIDSSADEITVTAIELDKRKNSILQSIKNHESPSRSVIRRDNPRDYIWHYRNNREWLYSILPNNSNISRKYNKVDWLKVDREILESVRNAINEIFKYTGKPIRVTRSEISRRIEHPNLLEYSLKKLPRTREVISRFIESTEGFQIRRINWLYDNWNKDVNLTIWRFKREAGIKKESEFIKKYLIILLS
ncbi:TnsD family Tn7-like transposition protein [Bacillus sp. B-jedd]|uniref:TnsD family Tn7-like transposition protein n=1 Tax=Bacillus sp. B-jedd TaxID=1476857 RepID=UPI0005155E9F|nr:TnsD family Tn7-like transposition protein [Bacillus sp. B-jedd]CEG25315.1 Tn7-like transposition protein D [Bacillus sp. B-jedd]